MACTIVRNAGKHATFESLTMMTTGPEWIARIECQVDGDPRLIEGASVIAAHVSRRAGLSDAAASEIAAAASQACGAAARVLGESGIPAGMKLAAAEFPDRIEVTIEPAPEILKEFSAQFASGASKRLADQIRQSLKSAAVDELDVEINDGVPRIILVKKSGAAKRRFVF
ncbi:MAG TPA: hypothetical protein VNK23_15490 [Candidatus Dormibacteraeota bacterium]|nr:hypothetical protein [Candidatus Dormibacteraeota bacterium]